MARLPKTFVFILSKQCPGASSIYKRIKFSIMIAPLPIRQKGQEKSSMTTIFLALVIKRSRKIDPDDASTIRGDTLHLDDRALV